MRILWVSNFSSDSAYAIQSHLYIPRLKALGHDVTVLEIASARSRARTIYMPNPNAGQKGEPDTVPVNIVPCGKDPLGSDSILGHFRLGGFHAVVTLIDPWGMKPEVMQHVPWFPFAPIDTQPVSPRNLDSLKACVRPIALTRWGQEQLQIAGLNPLYLPHGYDPAVWRPMDRARAREAIGIPPNVFFAAFVGVNDSNPSRKGIAELLFAWAMFRAQHDDALLYLHTDPQGNIPETGDRGGIEMLTMLKSLGLENDLSIRLVDVFRYRTFAIPASELALVANAADVLVLPGKGEGFGVPIIEFAACGTPSIVTNFGAMAELASQMGGQLVHFQPDWGWQNAMTAQVTIPAIVDALNVAYAERGTDAAAKRRQAALQGAQAYAINRVFMEHGLPVMSALAETTMEAVR